MTVPSESYIYYRIGDDGEWEQCRTSDPSPYQAANPPMDMIDATVKRTTTLPIADREIELERVLTLVEHL
ncbi:hypothetical protein [Pararhizobium sp. PWRC1-1]|uniref:hypothetical protein n=1 Tax=Pararhizobium sp. PWRC1-1 TaxID=2804566 RepID=UPI003CF4023D